METGSKQISHPGEVTRALGAGRKRDADAGRQWCTPSGARGRCGVIGGKSHPTVNDDESDNWFLRTPWAGSPRSRRMWPPCTC